MAVLWWLEGRELDLIVVSALQISDLMAQCDTAKEGVISFDQLYVALIEALDRRESQQ